MKFPIWLVNALKRPFCPTPTPPLPIAPRLPPGLTVDADGVISGTPTELGTFGPITVKLRAKPKKVTKSLVATKTDPRKRSTTRRKGSVGTQG